MGYTTTLGADKYVVVAAGQTASRVTYSEHTMLCRLIIVPAVAACGQVILYDGTGGSPVTVFTFTGGGVVALPDLKPIVVELQIRGTGAGNTPGWHITTGANVSVVAVVQDR